MGLGCGLTFFRFVDPQHDFFPDRMRLQDDVEPFPVIVWEWLCVGRNDDRV